MRPRFNGNDQYPLNTNKPLESSRPTLLTLVSVNFPAEPFLVVPSRARRQGLRSQELPAAREKGPARRRGAEEGTRAAKGGPTRSAFFSRRGIVWGWYDSREGKGTDRKVPKKRRGGECDGEANAFAKRVLTRTPAARLARPRPGVARRARLGPAQTDGRGGPRGRAATSVSGYKESARGRRMVTDGARSGALSVLYRTLCS